MIYFRNLVDPKLSQYPVPHFTRHLTLKGVSLVRFQKKGIVILETYVERRLVYTLAYISKKEVVMKKCGLE